MAQNIGWWIFMNPTQGGHSAQAFGLSGGLEVDWHQGSPAMASAEMIILGRPFIPVGRPLILPLSPGANSHPGPIAFGAGIGWSYGADGGAATFGWDIDSGDWQLKDEVQSPNRGLFQLASASSGLKALLSVQIVSALDTNGSVTLLVDGVSRGTLSNGDQVEVSGDVIALDVEVDFPTPSQDGFSVGYTLS